MPNPAIYRTEHTLVGYMIEDTFGNIMTPFPADVPPAQGVAQFLRFGIHDEATPPDASIEWTPFYGVSSGRSRSDIFPGRWTLRGSIPSIRLQAGLGYTSAVLGLCLGRTVEIPGPTAQAVALEDQDNGGWDGRLTSFNYYILARRTDFGLYPANATFIRQFLGCKINHWTLSAAEGGPLLLTIDDILACRVLNNKPNTNGYFAGLPDLTYEDLGPLIGPNFFFTGAQIAIAGVPLGRVKSMQFTCDNGLTAHYYQSSSPTIFTGGILGSESQPPNDLEEGKRAYQLTVELDVADESTDLQIYGMLLNQGLSDIAAGRVVGYPVTVDFQMVNPATPATPYAFNILCSPGFGGQNARPAAVPLEAPVILPAPPKGYWDGRITLNIDAVQIIMS